jgi:predicted GIY-YIG superfamily endonuclease
MGAKCPLYESFCVHFKCADGMYYTGITWNLKNRLIEHNKHIKSPIQPNRLPVTLVYWEEKSDKIEAAKREKEIKGWSRLKKGTLISSLL